MKLAMRLTMTVLVRALRLQAHIAAENAVLTRRDRLQLVPIKSAKAGEDETDGKR